MSTIYDGIAGLGSLSGLTAAQRMEALAKAQGVGTDESGAFSGSAFGQIFNSLIQNVNKGCSSLASVTIPSNVTVIVFCSFYCW